MTVPIGDGDIQLIPSVCFEDTVGRLTRKFVRTEPQLIINVTNDGWFKDSEAARQHMANAKFRAIELRRPMVRSANTGVSGIISTTGSLVDPTTGNAKSSKTNTAAILSGQVSTVMPTPPCTAPSPSTPSLAIALLT